MGLEVCRAGRPLALLVDGYDVGDDVLGGVVAGEGGATRVYQFVGPHLHRLAAVEGGVVHPALVREEGA